VANGNMFKDVAEKRDSHDPYGNTPQNR